ncbi:MAG TPA: ABC transporter ATP-binding protein [Chloroflexota bacterium]|nr:ABC transporter ATP-binding protein [Chloroflexota bacterium]
MSKPEPMSFSGPLTRGSVRVEGVAKFFPTPKTGEPQWVLRDVSLSLAGGEFVCLLGHSGCGKSTLLNLVAGYLKPDYGSITVSGRPVVGPSAERGVVFQDHALFPWLSVEENIVFGPRLQGKSTGEIRDVAERLIRLVGLTGSEHMYPSSLSGGMKQRVGIARALANEPDVLLMDEPFGALDMLTRESMQQELLRIWNALRPSIIFVTHSPSEAVVLADRVAVLSTHTHTIERLIEIDLPRPRSLRDPRFLDLVDEIESVFLDKSLTAVGGL